MKRLMIAGTRSGVGKTTVTLGVLAGFRAMDLIVQPFKVGPDYIDLSLHAALTGRPCYNLDGWMMPGEQLTETFVRAAAPHPMLGGKPEAADVAVVEGMMGLYDGVGEGESGGSAADIAMRLGLPVVLVLDVFAMAGSAGAAAMGYRDYEPDVEVAGVILNRVAGERHAAACKESLDRVDLPVLGVIPVDKRLQMGERHLGLIPAWERTSPLKRLDEMARRVAGHLDLEALAAVAGDAPTVDLPEPVIPERKRRANAVRIGVARDEAFGFYYQDTIDALQIAGAELVTFSPLRDEGLPDRIGGLYLGGGFPEEHLDALEANVPLRDAIRAGSEQGMPIYAECGGLMYLCRSIAKGDQRRSMVGVFDGHVRMGARQALAYVDVEVTRDTPLLPAGRRVRGHVFHNSVIELQENAATDFAYHLEPGPGIAGKSDGWRYKNVLASYTHLPLATHPELVERWLDACRAYRGVVSQSDVET